MTDTQLEDYYWRKTAYYECGICGQYHNIEFDGDCRQDDARFNPEDLDTKHGQFGWVEVDMPV